MINAYGCSYLIADYERSNFSLYQRKWDANVEQDIHVSNLKPPLNFPPGVSWHIEIIARLGTFRNPLSPVELFIVADVERGPVYLSCLI